MENNEKIAREIAENDILYGDSDNNSMIDECYIAALEMAKWKDEQARESFCLAVCKGRPPRSTCTSLGTCDDYDRFSKLMRGAEFPKNRGK